MRFFIKSFGCKVNQFDADMLKSRLESSGLLFDDKQPHLIIIYGCSVTLRAVQKVKQAITSLKKKWTEAKIVLAGCEAKHAKLFEVDTHKPDWFLIDNSANSVQDMIMALFEKPIKCKNTLELYVSSNIRAFLKIQDGCNQFCSYCIVSRLRGEEWSRPIAETVTMARRLAEAGHTELVLSGIHIGHYKYGLDKLLIELEKIKKVSRIRLGSVESIEVNNSLIDWIVNSKKSCKHIHLPLQSGCDKVLKAMNRPYSSMDYLNLVRTLKTKVSNISITTDIIVGFPGETEQDFSQTVEFVKKVHFARIHVFKFSPRENTPAAEMPNQISNELKAKRAAIMNQVAKELSLRYHKSFVGKPIEVLWETWKNGLLIGTSSEYINCNMKSDCKKVGELEKVYVKEAYENHVIACSTVQDA